MVPPKTRARLPKLVARFALAHFNGKIHYDLFHGGKSI
jgi:hypothetical protein